MSSTSSTAAEGKCGRKGTGSKRKIATSNGGYHVLVNFHKRRCRVMPLIRPHHCLQEEDPSKDETASSKPGTNKEMGLLRVCHTFGSIPCCVCGVPIAPNMANACANCLRSEYNITDVLPSRLRLQCCPDCDSYFRLPTTWFKAHRESRELLAFLLKGLKKHLLKFRVVDARFVHTEPHSMRLKLKLVVEKEVVNHSLIKGEHNIEYILQNQKCKPCSRGQDHWEAVVQVRQHVAHMRTFFHLEQLILRHKAASRVVKIKQVHDGIDFYFSSKRESIKFFGFLCKVVPIQQDNFHKKLVGQDTKSNISSFKFSIPALISPICHEDLIYLPSKISSSLGKLGPLVICTKVTRGLSLLDPFTLRYYMMDADEYWRTPFGPLLTSKQLLEYIVLDLEIVCDKADRKTSRHVLADAQVARVSDFGRNDTIFSIMTHLGHLLKPGDHALGYDLSGANFNDDDAEKHRVSLPDVILIKKISKEKSRNKRKPKAPAHRVEPQNHDSQYAQFLRDLEDNPESRFNLLIDDGAEQEPPLTTLVEHEEDPDLALEYALARLDLARTPESP